MFPAVALCLLAATADAPPWAASGKATVLRRKVTTSDGFALALYRYLPDGGGASKHPVLLIPDLGMGREAFDLHDSGFARYLQLHGREAFVLEARGQGMAAVPDWRLEDFVQKDLPAAVAVLQTLRPAQVDLVVQGYTGALVLAAASKELAGKVHRVVALSPAVDPEIPNPILGAALKAGGQLSRIALDEQAFDLLFAKGGHFPAGRLSELRGARWSDLGPFASRQVLRWLEQGDLGLGEGSTLKGRLALYDRPTLEFLPLQDNFAHGEFASALRDLAPRAQVAVRVTSTVDLFAEDYTHLSLLHGSGAAEDIFAPGLAFLNQETP